MKGAVSRMSVNSMSGIDLELPLELRNIQEFFLLMTICNTVVVSPHEHHDMVSAYSHRRPIGIRVCVHSIRLGKKAFGKDCDPKADLFGLLYANPVM